MDIPDGYPQRISEAGVACIGGCLSAPDINRLRQAVDCALKDHRGDESVRDRGGVFAIRNVTEVVPQIRQLAHH